MSVKKTAQLREVIVRSFYDAEAGLFCTPLKGRKWSGAAILPQALAVGTDCRPEKEDDLCRKLKNGLGLILITLFKRLWQYA